MLSGSDSLMKHAIGDVTLKGPGDPYAFEAFLVVPRQRERHSYRASILYILGDLVTPRYLYACGSSLCYP